MELEINMDNNCGLCLSRDNLITLFQFKKEIAMKFKDAFFQFTSFEMEEKANICGFCCCFINTWCKFRTLCHETQSFLTNGPSQQHLDGHKKIIEDAMEIRRLFNKTEVDTYYDNNKDPLNTKDSFEDSTNTPSNPATPENNYAEASQNEVFSSDDELTLSVHKQKLLKTKSNNTRAPRSLTLRTVQTQTGVNIEDLSVSEGETFESTTTCGAVTINNRKTQTENRVKRWRVRVPVPSPCTICDKVYKNSEILRQHMKSHHVPGVIECEQCLAKFSTVRSLKYHQQRNHSNIEPVQCSFCGKKFLDKKYLRVHENIHSQSNRFVCQFCGRSFVMKTNLTVHITRHHTKKNNDFVCQMCGKAFPFKLYLKKHFKTHTDEKPHSCTHCGAKFRENTVLKKHINSIHLKLRPHVCQYCHRTFTRSLYLKEHLMSQHLGVPKIVTCQGCGGKFKNRTKLKQHNCTGNLEVEKNKPSSPETSVSKVS